VGGVLVCGVMDGVLLSGCDVSWWCVVRVVV